MVARGVLGIELPLEKTFMVQKYIISKCHEVIFPLIKKGRKTSHYFNLILRLHVVQQLANTSGGLRCGECRFRPNRLPYAYYWNLKRLVSSLVSINYGSHLQTGRKLF